MLAFEVAVCQKFLPYSTAVNYVKVFSQICQSHTLGRGTQILNAKFISVSLKNRKHKGNYKPFILSNRKRVHRIPESICEEEHQLMSKFLQL